MSSVIYSLCALTCLTCCVLLWRAHQRSNARLLFWSALCFALLTVNNLMLVVDKVILPTEVDLKMWRLTTALGAVCLLLYGLIWDEE